ncbi:MAG: hypothetical protein DRI34_06215 [Deltaproteobacteria bacterium]|nr:MAG: hypothetical protein DRI34_06215 [Deltaproteobacteria bacterium]
MSLTSSEIAAVVQELRAVLAGVRLEKVSAPDRRSCLLALRGRGRNWLLLLVLQRGQQRLHLLEEKSAPGTAPPAWVMKLRAELQGRRLEHIESEAGGRLVSLSFTGQGDQAGRRLEVELFGSGRLLLCDGSGQPLFACIGTARAADDRPRQAASGRARPAGNRFGEPDAESLAVNRRVARYYEERRQQHEAEQLRTRLAGALGRVRKKTQRLVANLEGDLERAEAAGRLRRQAELLKTHLPRLQRGQARVDLPDVFADGQPIEVELDPALSPAENMQRMFTRARRLERAAASARQRLDEARRRLGEIETLLERVRQTDDGAGLAELLPQVERFTPPLRDGRRSADRGPARRLPYRSFRSASGKTILVGRSARDNHRLTFALAHGSDLWLHARGRPGAHVVVRLGRNDDIDESTLLDAATLAAQYSGEKDPGELDITYTRVKNLRPVKGKPGQVWVSREKTIRIRIEPDRLARLKKSNITNS